MKTSNPALKVFNRTMSTTSTEVMTLEGTINKTAILLLILVLSGSLTWKLFLAQNGWGGILTIVGLIGSLITALIAIFAPKTIHITAPLYALFEGLLLGVISFVYYTHYNGILFKPFLLTLIVFGLMLLLYKFKILRASGTFIRIIVIATGAIALYYLLSIILSFFRIDISLATLDVVGIILQLGIVIIAALNFVLDFKFIEDSIQNNLPKKMEWYGGFTLLITLVWLYIEILRLLALLSNRK